MRTREELMCEAIRTGKALPKTSNTTVTAPDARGRVEVFLHGHKIAVLYGRTLSMITFAGYPTVTTISRIKALLAEFAPGYRLRLSKGKAYLGKQIAGPYCEREIGPSEIVVLAPVEIDTPTHGKCTLFADGSALVDTGGIDAAVSPCGVVSKASMAGSAALAAHITDHNALLRKIQKVNRLRVMKLAQSVQFPGTKRGNSA